MLELKGVKVVYDKKIVALKDIDLNIEQGEFIGVIGSSGSGKSTLLKTINLLVRPSQGEVLLDGKDIASVSPKELRKIRADIGFIFQDYNLIERSTVLENVLIGRLPYTSTFKSLLGIFKDDDYDRAAIALRQVGLSDKIFKKADDLSGGEKQRVAIAKTLCQRPRMILADEPVASLDRASSQSVMEYFKKVNEKKNITILINLHDVDLALKYSHRILAIKDGMIIFDGKPGELDEGILKEIYQK